MAKYTLFAGGGKVHGQKKLKDGNYASHKVSLEQDGKTKKYFVAYVNEGDDRVANFYDTTGKFVMDMKVSDGGKLISEGKMKKVMDYELPKENVKVRDVSVKDMNYSELRQYIQDKYVDNLKDAEFYFNIYETSDSIEFVDESIRDQHKEVFEQNADYLEKDFEKKTGLKIDGFEMLDEDGSELEEVTSGNTYNYGYLGGADFNYRVYKTSDGEKYFLMALIHMGGDIRGNYGDAFIFEGDSEDEVLSKFQGLLSGGAHIHLRFKDGSSISFDSQQDSDVWYFEVYDRVDDPLSGLAKQYYADFESYGSWHGDEFLETTIEEFNEGKKVRSYEDGGENEYAKGGEVEKGDTYRAAGIKWGVFLKKPRKDIQKLLQVNSKTTKRELRELLPTIYRVSDSLYNYVKPDSISGDFGIDPFEYHKILADALVSLDILKSQDDIDNEEWNKKEEAGDFTWSWTKDFQGLGYKKRNNEKYLIGVPLLKPNGKPLKYPEINDAKYRVEIAKVTKDGKFVYLDERFRGKKWVTFHLKRLKTTGHLEMGGEMAKGGTLNKINRDNYEYKGHRISISKRDKNEYTYLIDGLWWSAIHETREDALENAKYHIDNGRINYGKYAKGGGVGEKTLSRRYLENRGRNVFTFGYGMPKDAIDMYGTVGGAEYYELPNGEVYKKIKGTDDKFLLIRKK